MPRRQAEVGFAGEAPGNIAEGGMASLCFVSTLGVRSKGCSAASKRAMPRWRMSVLEKSPSMPVVLLSDLHVDSNKNRQFVLDLCEFNHDQAIVVAGDISHDMDRLEEALRALTRGFRRVFFVFGNHELWVTGSRAESGRALDSLAKADEVSSMCDTLGVIQRPHILGSVLVVPLPSWYDLTVEVPAEPKLYDGFQKWPWTDFQKCQWPAELQESYPCRGGRYPSHVASYFDRLNHDMISDLVEELDQYPSGHLSALSYSHFLPGTFALPDWIESESDEFRPSWILHPAASTAAKFSRVAGSTTIETQLRRLTPHVSSHIHCFGHSHRPKDFWRFNVRYVHHPLGKPAEREMGMAPIRPGTKLVIDGEGRVVPATYFTRYWECLMQGEDPLQFTS